jgi:DNA mismatch endonuclease (patch repair protein)
MSSSWSARARASSPSLATPCRRYTKPELLLRSVLHSRGCVTRVAARPLPFVHRTADVVFARQGGGVHRRMFLAPLPHHYRQPSSNADYWVAKVNRNVARDQEVDSLLHDAGWTVVRVWEHDDPVAAADFVERLVGKTREQAAEERVDHNQITSKPTIRIENCFSSGYVPPAGFEPATPALGEPCSIP